MLCITRMFLVVLEIIRSNNIKIKENLEMSRTLRMKRDNYYDKENIIENSVKLKHFHK